MPSTPPSSSPGTRRARRAAERQQNRVAPPGSRSARRRPQPVVLATIAAIVIGLGLVAFLALSNQPPPVSAGIIQPVASTPASLAHDRTLGDPAAPITLDVWSDNQCPYCDRFWTSVAPGLISKYIQTGEARLVYHDYTFIGPESLSSAIAARAADQQGKFWPYHDLLFANQRTENSGAFSAARLADFARAIGLDMGTWTAALSDPTISQAIQQETAAGQALGINGTPTLFVNGVKVASFDLPTVSAAIDAARNSQAPGSPAPTPPASAVPTATP